MYYAIIQEYDILYREVLDRDIPLKKGLGRVVAFLLMSVHEKVKML